MRGSSKTAVVGAVVLLQALYLLVTAPAGAQEPEWYCCRADNGAFCCGPNGCSTSGSTCSAW